MPKNSRVFLDIDLDSHREKYQRAADFVEATDLRYGWTSKYINELGGGEKQRVLECYADDFDWGSKGPIEIEPPARCFVKQGTCLNAFFKYVRTCA